MRSAPSEPPTVESRPDDPSVVVPRGAAAPAAALPAPAQADHTGGGIAAPANAQVTALEARLERLQHHERQLIDGSEPLPNRDALLRCNRAEQLTTRLQLRRRRSR